MNKIKFQIVSDSGLGVTSRASNNPKRRSPYIRATDLNNFEFSLNSKYKKAVNNFNKSGFRKNIQIRKLVNNKWVCVRVVRITTD